MGRNTTEDSTTFAHQAREIYRWYLPASGLNTGWSGEIFSRKLDATRTNSPVALVSSKAERTLLTEPVADDEKDAIVIVRVQCPRFRSEANRKLENSNKTAIPWNKWCGEKNRIEVHWIVGAMLDESLIKMLSFCSRSVSKKTGKNLIVIISGHAGAKISQFCAGTTP
jgi:hypothetical protein